MRHATQRICPVPDFRIGCRSIKVNPFVRYLPDYEPLIPTWKRMRPVLKRQRTDPGHNKAPA